MVQFLDYNFKGVSGVINPDPAANRITLTFDTADLRHENLCLEDKNVDEGLVAAGYRMIEKIRKQFTHHRLDKLLHRKRYEADVSELVRDDNANTLTIVITPKKPEEFIQVKNQLEALGTLVEKREIPDRPTAGLDDTGTHWQIKTSTNEVPSQIRSVS